MQCGGMTDNLGWTRRRVLRGVSVTGLFGMAGCLRVTRGDNAETVDNPSPSTTDTADNGNTPDDEDSEKPSDFDVALAPRWEHDTRSAITSADQDFFTGWDALTRISPGGTIVFESEEFAGDGYMNIDNNWRKSLYADDLGVYVGVDPDNEENGGRMYALDPTDGDILWEHSEPDDGLHDKIRATTRVDDFVIFASQSSGSGSDQRPIIRALDAETGEQQWQIDRKEGFVTQIIPNGDRIHVQQTFGIFTYDISTRDLVEEHEFGHGFNQMIQFNDSVYIPHSTIRKLDISLTQQLWSAKTEYDVNTRPAIGANGVFIGTESGFVAGFDRESGEQLWESRVEGVVSHPPVVENGLVWIADERGGLSALATSTGDRMYHESVEPDFSFTIIDGILKDDVRETAFEIKKE